MPESETDYTGIIVGVVVAILVVAVCVGLCMCYEHGSAYLCLACCLKNEDDEDEDDEIENRNGKENEKEGKNEKLKEEMVEVNKLESIIESEGGFYGEETEHK